MVYLDGKDSGRLVRAVSDSLQTACWVNYEQVNPDDTFGQMMLHNLQQRDCPLLGLTAWPTLEAQRERFLANGWEGATAMDMNDVYARLPAEDARRWVMLRCRLAPQACMGAGYLNPAPTSTPRPRCLCGCTSTFACARSHAAECSPSPCCQGRAHRAVG